MLSPYHWVKNRLLPCLAGLIFAWMISMSFGLFSGDGQSQTNKHHTGGRDTLIIDNDAQKGSLAHASIVTPKPDDAGAGDQKTGKKAAKPGISSRLARNAGVSESAPKRGVMKKVSRVFSAGGSTRERQSGKGGGVKQRLLNEAYALALKSERPWENLIAIAREHYRQGRLDDSREMLVIAEKLAIDPDDPEKSSFAVREVVKAMLSMKQTGDAEDAMQNIQSARQRERVYADIAAWSARQGDVPTARNFLTMITDPVGRDLALLAIAEGEASLEGVGRSLLTAGMIANHRRKDDALKRIAIKRALLKDFLGADQSLQQIRDDRRKDQASIVIARYRARSGDMSGGLQMLSQISHGANQDEALRDLSADLARMGEFSNSAFVIGRIKDENQKSNALEYLSIEQTKAGELSAALVKVSSIPVDTVRDRSLRGVSATAAQVGDLGRARNVAVRISSVKERDRAYREIAQAAAAGGENHVAYNTMQEIAHPEQKAHALVAMARYRLRQGDERAALSLLEDANRSSQEVSRRSRERIHAGMAVAYAERLDSDRSLLLAQSISDPRQRDITYGVLARTLAVKNDVPAALQSVSAIQSKVVRLRAEDDVARAMARRTDPQQAMQASRMLHSGRQRIVFLLEVSRKG